MNCFIIRKAPERVTLRDVRDNFPVPGDYHFRFQYSYKLGGVTVWLDLPSEDSLVPSVEHEIRVKVTRHSWNEGRTNFHRQQMPAKQIKQIEHYLIEQDAERQGGDQASMGSEALSMFSNIASKAKNVLGGVASQVANSMPQPTQLNPQANPPQQFKAPRMNQNQ